MPHYDSPYDPSTAPKDFKFVVYEKKAHVAYVTINRPEVRNALHSYAYAELRACWRDIGLDPNIYCGIVTTPTTPCIIGAVAANRATSISRSR